jgi:HlyD family secretion protein
MPDNREFEPQASIRRHLLACAGLSVALFFGFGGWAVTTEFSGAVIAEGQLVVESNVKTIQHPTGGVVGELLVQEGSVVKASDILLRLDNTQIKANLAIIVKEMNELVARKARGEAERDGHTSVEFPPDLNLVDDPEIAVMAAGEQRLFEIKRAAREGQKAQLSERIQQLKQEITGLTGQEAGKARELELIKKELEGVHDLWAKKLVPFTRVTALEREAARIEGERGTIIASIAQARGKISETELQIVQIDQTMRTEVSKELAEIRARTAELTEKRVAAEDQLKRVDIRSPQDGTVNQLAVHTIGGVITPGQPIMLIVPNADALVVEARIQPGEIDQVYVEQPAMLRFVAFNQATTSELKGEVSWVSADVTQDNQKGVSYYRTRIRISPGELQKLEGQKIVPGMPVEVFLQTTTRTVASYMVRPLHDQLARAVREK